MENKLRKKRDYSSMFGKEQVQLPSPEEVDAQVAKLTHKQTAEERHAIETTPTKRGRKPLPALREPYTTSLTQEHKFKLKYYAIRRGLRPSDMLDLILDTYFADNEA